MNLAALIVALGAAFTPAAQDERPAPVLQPPAPPIERAGPASAEDAAVVPTGSALARDSFIADRFTADGQQVVYTFEAADGELSILDLGTWGYSRGWKATAGLRILGPDGAELVAAEESGGTTFRLFQVFVAPKEGTYSVELSALEQYFRYTLVRHSQYRYRPSPAPVELAKRPTTHGFLSDHTDTVTYRVPVRAGERVALRVNPTHPQAHKQARMMRSRARGKVVRGEPLGMPRGRSSAAPETGEPSRSATLAQGLAFPRLALSVAESDGAALSEKTHFHAFTPTTDGDVFVTVAAIEGRGGALFDLQVLRDLQWMRVTGYVGDRDDEPVSGVTVHILHDPEVDPLASVVTAEDGTWSAKVLAGRVTLLMQRGTSPLEQVSLAIEENGLSEINTIYAH